jgi:hypothetical protein
MRAFGVCKHTSMRARVERQKRRKKNMGGRKRMENTRTPLCFLNIDRREREGGQVTIGKNILAEREEKQSRLEMCIDVEYVQKKCTHTQRLSLYILFS